MKKITAIIFVFLFAGSSLSAQFNFSIGGGGVYKVDNDSDTYKFSGTNRKVKQSGPAGNYGGFFGFFDAVYAEADICLFFSSTAYIDNNPMVSSITALQFGLLGKFPFYAAGITFFPLVGFQFFLPLAWTKKEINTGEGGSIFKEDSAPTRFEISQFWVRIGAGADLFVTSQIFVRPSFLWGFRFKNKEERDLVKNAKAKGDRRSYFNHGFEFRLAAGYRF